MNEILNLLNPWWFNRPFVKGIDRPKYGKKLTASLKHKRAVLLVGSRRVGKTTLFYQTIARLLERTFSKHILYVLVDHPQLSSFKILDLVKEYRKQFILDRNQRVYLFFDEIQYLKNWEREIKALLDTENVKIFLSGSASSHLILKSPYLTGRVEKIEVSPLDFNEFLAFKRVKVSETEQYKYEKYTDEYLKTGGYPEYVLGRDPTYFSDLVNNILFKDIVNLYQLRNPDSLRDLFLLLADRVGYQTTYTKLATILALKNDTVKEYIYYLKNTFLLDELPRATLSRSARIYGPKKFYLIDNGILFNLLGRLSYSSAFEQTLFNFFKFQSKKIGFYYENQREVDFVVENNNKEELWEAKYKVDDKFKIKLNHYLQIANLRGAKKIVFVTKSYEEKLKIEKVQIKFVPLWQIILNQ